MELRRRRSYGDLTIAQIDRAHDALLDPPDIPFWAYDEDEEEESSGDESQK
jgi:hypothetical protein